LFAIAHHKWVDHVRKAKRTVRDEPLDEAVFESSLSQTFDASVELSVDIEAAINQLPEKQRQAVVHLKIKDLSVKETAKRLGMGLSAVKVNAHRAYRTLRELLGGDQ